MSVHDTKPHIDAFTGTATTGHEWDGVRELNNPLPRWWLWIFYATIVWSVGYWVVYPAWPLVTTYTKGLFGYATRSAIVDDLNALKAQRAAFTDKIAAASLQDIVADPQLLSFARAQGRAAFADNCAPCHGAGGGGAKGYPNLNDDDWMWGGKLDDIALTITHGVRSSSDQARTGAAMPAFGRDGMLPRADLAAAADYVRSLSNLPLEAKADVARGKKVFAENCASCHGEDAKGNRELGAPNLTDGIWLYGSSKPEIIESVWNGRGGMMPAWGGRLDPTTIKALAVYVHTLGGGEK